MPERTHIGGERLQRLADNQGRERPAGGYAQLVAAPDGEGQAVAFEAIGAISLKHNICGRVIGIAIHGIRAVECARGGEADVARYDIGDGDWQAGAPYLVSLRQHSTLSSF